jgi:uncharacterized protein DUF4105
LRRSVLLLALLLATPLAAQDSAAVVIPGSEYRVSVLTAGVGAEVWELWGHNMIRVRNDATGEDVVYNWGMFSFSQPGFVRRFLMGRMNYWMASEPTARILRLYQHRDRTMVEQHLALAPAQRDSLVRFLEWNALEENRYYHYDYYLDNCSTRLRDALDLVLGGALRRATEGIPSPVTFREETRRLSGADLPLYTGLMLGLGPATDRPVTKWEGMFLPRRVMEELSTLQIPDSAGTLVPVVAVEETLYVSQRFPEPVDGPKRLPFYLAIGIGVGGVLALLGYSGRPKTFLALGGLMTLLVGFGGAVLTFLMGFTDHSVTYGNENALLLSFLTLFLAFTLRPAIGGSPRAQRLVQGLAVAVTGLALCAILVKATPWGHQDNWEMIALFLPVDLGLAVGSVLSLNGPRWRPPRQR